MHMKMIRKFFKSRVKSWNKFFKSQKRVLKRWGLMGFLTLIFAGYQNCAPQNFTKMPEAPLVCSSGMACPLGNGNLLFTQDVNYTNSTTKNQLDILVVTDNSNSMGEAQENLGDKSGGFISGLNGVDYHVAVTTTDTCTGAMSPTSGDTYGCTTDPTNSKYHPGPGAQGKFVTSTGNQSDAKFTSSNYKTHSVDDSVASSNIETWFQDTVVRFSNKHLVSGDAEVGSPNERAIKALNLSLDGTTPFFRDKTNLAVIILSDEDEVSTGYSASYTLGGTTYPLMVPGKDDPESLLLNVKTDSRWGSVSSLFVGVIGIIPGDGVCLNEQSGGGVAPASYANVYADLVSKTIAQGGSGFMGSICNYGADRFKQMLSKLTIALVNQTQPTSIKLYYKPVPGTLTVTSSLNGSAPVNFTAYSYNAVTNSVDVNSPLPPDGTKLSVSYQYNPNNP